MDPKAWIDALARDAHGCPHHILSCVLPAAVDQLKASDGTKTTDGLYAVFQIGGEGRKAYSEQTVKGFAEGSAAA